MANRLRLQLSDRAHDAPWNPEEALAAALAEKMEFLNQHPEYREFQQEIDRLLDNAGTPENRMTVLAMLMEGKLIELHQQLHKLNGILLNAGVKPSNNRHLYTDTNFTRISNN